MLIDLCNALLYLVKVELRDIRTASSTSYVPVTLFWTDEQALRLTGMEIAPNPRFDCR
jgi:hypothetical protein